MRFRNLLAGLALVFLGGCNCCSGSVLDLLDPNTEAFKAAERLTDKTLDSRNKAWVRDALRQKYAEEFVVHEAFFEIGLNHYQFKASPRGEPQVTFRGDFDERPESPAERLRSDSYTNAFLAHQARDHFAEVLGTKPTSVLEVSVYSRHQHTHGDPVVDLDQFLRERPDRSTIRHNLYVFTVPESAADPAVETIRRSLEGLHAKYGNEFSLYVGFWGPAFLRGRQPDKLTFGFENKGVEDADDLITEREHLARYLFVKITSGSIESLTNEAIFDLIKPPPESGPMVMTEI